MKKKAELGEKGQEEGGEGENENNRQKPPGNETK